MRPLVYCSWLGDVARRFGDLLGQLGERVELIGLSVLEAKRKWGGEGDEIYTRDGDGELRAGGAC